MEEFVLKKIFNTYLHRDPVPREFLTHGKKREHDLINDILNCAEYRDLQKKLSTEGIKVAILISGHIRNNVLVPSLSKLNGLNYDVFVHTWDNLGFKGNETNIEDKVKRGTVERTLNEIPNLKSFKIENNKEYLSNVDDKTTIYFNFSSPEKFIKSQLYSVNQSFKIFDEYRRENKIKYDLVIKARFDISFTEFNIVPEFIEDLNNHKIIFVPNSDCGHSHPDSDSTSCQICDKMYKKFGMKNPHISEHSHVICDLFAYGSYNSMKKYFSLYEQYDNINKSFVKKNLELIEKYNIKHELRGNVYFLERDDEGHTNSLFYLNCSYPEKLLQVLLKDFLLPTSDRIKVKFQR